MREAKTVRGGRKRSEKGGGGRGGLFHISAVTHVCAYPPARGHTYEGPGQTISPSPGKMYSARSWAKILHDNSSMIGQTLEMEVSFDFYSEYLPYNAC